MVSVKMYVCYAGEVRDIVISYVTFTYLSWVEGSCVFKKVAVNRLNIIVEKYKSSRLPSHNETFGTEAYGHSYITICCCVGNHAFWFYNASFSQLVKSM